MGEIANQIKPVNFTRMEDGTAEEYAFLTPLYEKCRNIVSDRLQGKHLNLCRRSWRKPPE